MHSSDEALQEYAVNSGLTLDAVEVEKHLSECAACRDRFHALLLDLLLDRPDALHLDAAETRRLRDELAGSSELLNRNVENARRMASEEVEAEEHLGQYLVRHTTRLDRFRWSNLLRNKKHHTAGMVTFLSRAARERSNQPLVARVLAENAVSISEALPDDHYLGEYVNILRARAWTERGNAHHDLGDFRVALDSYERALRAYSRVVNTEFHQTVINYGRARTLSQCERFDEALVLLTQCEEYFARYPDSVRYQQARLVRGATLFRLGEITAAIEVWEKVRLNAETVNDMALTSRLSNNIGFARLRLGDIVAARLDFEQALRGFSRLALKEGCLQAQGGLAIVAIKSGPADRGIELLQATIREFERLGMLNDSMIASLDLADALLAVGKNRDAERLCRGLAKHFKAAGLKNASLRALDYLRQAAAASDLDRTKIKYVRDFVERLISNPTLIFAPPATDVA